MHDPKEIEELRELLEMLTPENLYQIAGLAARLKESEHVIGSPESSQRSIEE